MIIDSSALIAILLGEPQAADLVRAIGKARLRRMSAVSFLETGIVILARRGQEGVRALDAFMERAGIEVRPFDRDQATIARVAFDRFGCGRHRAKLNFGDCAAYAAARAENLPLLCTGEDFRLTDIRCAP